jgi:hypothetical protein
MYIYIYVRVLGNSVIRLIDTGGIISTYAGSGKSGTFEYYLYVDSLTMAGLHLCVGLDFVSPSL